MALAVKPGSLSVSWNLHGGRRGPIAASFPLTPTYTRYACMCMFSHACMHTHKHAHTHKHTHIQINVKQMKHSGQLRDLGKDDLLRDCDIECNISVSRHLHTRAQAAFLNFLLTSAAFSMPNFPPLTSFSFASQNNIFLSNIIPVSSIYLQILNF